MHFFGFPLPLLPEKMNDVTRIIRAIESGNRKASEELLPLVYDELRRLAYFRLSGIESGQTLQPTALVHEAYVRLVEGEAQRWDSKGHFFAAAAEAMRRILVEQARRKASQKHGGSKQRVELAESKISSPETSEDLVALDEALDQFELEHPEKAKLVKLRYFAGLQEEQAAELMGISRATASRYWKFGKTWLFKKIGSCGPDE